ncbi:MAG: DUF2779 domain-containing protein, partial [Bacteroidota bacterium]
STFVKGCQCTKAFYLNKFHPELKEKITEKQQAIFDAGTSVGEIAQQLFPGGVDASPETPYEFQKSVALTKQLIVQGHKIIYEAAFQFDGVLCALDILIQKNKKWYAFEVKGSTQVKDQFILDAALQYFVITNSGIPLADISIIHLNNQYVRKGELNIQELFSTESVLENIKDQQDFISEKITELKAVLKQKEIPDVKIGEHCFAPYDCDFIKHCWKKLPEENSVFSLSRIGNKAFLLIEDGIFHLDDIPADFPLTQSTEFQLRHYKSGKEFLDKNEIENFLSEFKYPLHFFDFETYMPAVPEFDYSRPYQQIPFQYSLHFLNDAKSKTEHCEFLGDGVNDPREALIPQMLDDLGTKGSIIAYNKSFEETQIKKLAIDFPKYAIQLLSLIDRFIDLAKPFQKRWYYKPAFEGEYSLKAVLPVLVPELSYQSLDIQEGGIASLVYSKLKFQKDETKIIQRKQLLEYCKMDTLAIVKILERMEKLI